jgi:hypothetical protein
MCGVPVFSYMCTPNSIPIPIKVLLLLTLWDQCLLGSVLIIFLKNEGPPHPPTLFLINFSHDTQGVPAQYHFFKMKNNNIETGLNAH